MPSVRALLFDLGGVVIDIDFDRMLDHWLPYSRLTLAQMRARLQADEPYRRHERGEIDAARYMAHLSEVFELEADIKTVIAGWNAMLVDEIPTVLDLIERLRPKLPCYAFSNTSAVHHAEWGTRFPRVGAAFEQLFLSFELGLRKPERAAYDAVAKAIGSDPASILFFDDTEDNVLGARRAGLDAVLVSHPDDISEALARHGVDVRQSTRLDRGRSRSGAICLYISHSRPGIGRRDHAHDKTDHGARACRRGPRRRARDPCRARRLGGCRSGAGPAKDLEEVWQLPLRERRQ